MRREIYKKSEFGFVSGEKDLANDGATVKILEKVFTLADKIMNMITYSTHLHRIDETKAFRSPSVDSMSTQYMLQYASNSTSPYRSGPLLLHANA